MAHGEDTAVERVQAGDGQPMIDGVIPQTRGTAHDEVATTRRRHRDDFRSSGALRRAPRHPEREAAAAARDGAA